MSAETSHGHVVPRKDGVKARCGGPALCSACAKELALVSALVPLGIVGPAGTMRGSIIWAPNPQLESIPDRSRSDETFHDWICRCGSPLVVIWTSSCSTYDGEHVADAIKPDDALTDWWKVECHNGHVLLLCHELAEDSSADTFDPPTTAQIIAALATAEEIARWKADR